MALRDLKTVENFDEQALSCACCGEDIYQGTGILEWNAEPTASYWYSWSDGHQGNFFVAVHWGEADDEKIVIASCQCAEGGTQLSITDPESSPWQGFAFQGRVLSREEAIAELDYPEYFELFDAVIEKDIRLAPRVIQYEHNL